MPQPVEKLAVLFADICGSTALYENLGDDLARQMITHCIGTMVKQVSIFQGRLIKTIGDEIMCAFPGAEAAFHAACAMQTALEQDPPQNGGRMHIRIGFHYGEVIHEEGDVFGDTVNVAARITAVTRADQIMTTLAAVNELPLALREKARQIMRAEFKGKHEGLDIFYIVYKKVDLESTRIGLPAYRKSPDNVDEMVLRYREQTLKVSKERRSVILGRGETCDMMVPQSFASRLHCRIELRFGKFIITDQSTNSTFIRYSDKTTAFINHEELVLQGSGHISLGQSFTDNPVELVEFSITSTHVPPKTKP